MSVTGWGGNVTLTVEVAFSSATGTYGAFDASNFDSATWGPDVVWQDITAFVRSIDTQRQFSRETSRWQAGTGTMVLSNGDGRFSPNLPSGPYSSGGITGIRPWVPLRIRATYASTTYSLFTGYAISWLEGYPGLGFDDTMTVSFVDEFGKLAAWNGLAQTSQGQGDSAGGRLTRILNATGSTANRSIATGTQTMQATTLAGDAMSLLDLTNDSEGGWLWVDADGTIVFEDRLSPIELSRINTSQVTFGEQEIQYTDLSMAYDGDRLVNMASIARAGGTAQSAYDSTSRALYGDRQYARSDLICESDAQVQGIAQLLVAAKKDPKLRIVSAEFMPMGQPLVLWPQVLGRRVRDKVTIKRRPTWQTITQLSTIEGVAHSIKPEQWTTEFFFADAAPWGSFATSRWDTGLFDTATWFY